MSSNSWVVWTLIVIMLIVCIGIIVMFFIYENYPKKTCININNIDNKDDIIIE
jgi:hypothetical protein